MNMDFSNSTMIAFGIGFVLAGFIAIMVMRKLVGDEGWEFAKAHMKGEKKRKQGRFFMIVEDNNRAHFEYATKDLPENPFYELRNGVLAFDPSQHESEAPLRFSKGLECYQGTPMTPQLISTKQTLFLKRMVQESRRAHPELDGVISDAELVSLITTERGELWHDLENFCAKPGESEGEKQALEDYENEDDDFDDENPNQTAEYIWDILSEKDRDFQNIVMSTLYRNMKGGNI